MGTHTSEIVEPEEGQGAHIPLDLGRSVNPIFTNVGRLCSPYYNSHPPPDFQTFYHLVTLNCKENHGSIFGFTSKVMSSCIVLWVLCTSTIMYYMHLLLGLRGFRLTRLFPRTKSRVNQGVSVPKYTNTNPNSKYGLGYNPLVFDNTHFSPQKLQFQYFLPAVAVSSPSN